MHDYPQWKMFIQEGVEHVSTIGHTWPGMIIVSTFTPVKTESDNVLALRDLYRGFPYQMPPELVCSDDFGIVIFHTPKEGLSALRQYCRKAVQNFDQTGYVEWNGKQAKFINAIGEEIALTAWDGTANCLESWVQHLHPNFQIKGIWNREMTYVNKKSHEKK